MFFLAIFNSFIKAPEHEFDCRLVMILTMMMIMMMMMMIMMMIMTMIMMMIMMMMMMITAVTQPFFEL